MRFSRPITLGIAIFACLPILDSISHAYITRAFAVRGLLDSAELVCHGKILSIGKSGVEPDASFHPPLRTDGHIARVRVLNIVKGHATDEIDVAFRLNTSDVMYTQLAEGNQCILFLRRQGKAYRFVDDHNGTLQIPPHEPLVYKSDSPDARLVEELIFGTRKDTGLIRLVCTEQLAQFSDVTVVRRLEELTHEDDMAVQGVAYAGLIVLDQPPLAADLSKFLARAEDTKSMDRFQTSGYSNGHLKNRVLGALEGRFNIIERDLVLRAAEKWKGFDVISVLKSVSFPNDYESSCIGYRTVAEIVGEQVDEKGAPAVINKTYRKGSKGLIVGLLTNDNREVRFAAARAVDRMLDAPHHFQFPQLRDWEAGGKVSIDKYVDACRDWVTAHRDWANE